MLSVFMHLIEIHIKFIENPSNSRPQRFHSSGSVKGNVYHKPGASCFKRSGLAALQCVSCALFITALTCDS